MKFKKEQLARVKLTGDIVMILEPVTFQLDKTGTFIDGYWVRLPSYTITRIAEFELINIE